VLGLLVTSECCECLSKGCIYSIYADPDPARS
jgi:hypothetical protein